MRFYSCSKTYIVLSLFVISSACLALFFPISIEAKADSASLQSSIKSRVASATTSPNCGAWSVVSSPNAGMDTNILNGVATISARNVWAVGSYYYNSGSSTASLIEHWNGTKWSLVFSPNIGSSSSLSGVARVPGTNKLWAVGRYINGSISQTLTEYWNGTQWSIVSSPNLGSGANYLDGLTAISASDIWAVGSYDNSSGYAQTLTEHWDGTSWNIVSSPNPGTVINTLFAVTWVPGTHQVWAVGYSYNISGPPSQTLIEEWNGTSWSAIPSPNVGTGYNYLRAVSAVSMNTIWAAGDFSNGGVNGPQTLIEHWNGTSWNITTSPNSGAQNELFGVAVVSASNIWAVGEYNYTSSPPQTLIEHWNGTSWNIVSSPNPGIVASFSGVARVPGTSQVWAVGGNNSPVQTLTEFSC